MGKRENYPGRITSLNAGWQRQTCAMSETGGGNEAVMNVNHLNGLQENNMGSYSTSKLDFGKGKATIVAFKDWCAEKKS